MPNTILSSFHWIIELGGLGSQMRQRGRLRAGLTAVSSVVLPGWTLFSDLGRAVCYLDLPRFKKFLNRVHQQQILHLPAQCHAWTFAASHQLPLQCQGSGRGDGQGVLKPRLLCSEMHSLVTSRSGKLD